MLQRLKNKEAGAQGEEWARKKEMGDDLEVGDDLEAKGSQTVWL